MKNKKTRTTINDYPSKNKFINKKTYFNVHMWYSNYGSFLLPTILVDKNIPISPLVTTTRISLLFLKFRFTIDIGTKISIYREFSWDGLYLSEFLNWLNKTQEYNITKERLVSLVNDNIELKTFLQNTDSRNYYTRVLLAQHIKSLI